MQMSGRQILVRRSLCMPKEQYKGINVHDVVNDFEGLQCIYIGQFQTGSAIWKFSHVRGSIQQSKRLD